MTPNDLLKKPYSNNIVREDDGSYRAEVIEFPGCIAVGDSPSEAFNNLQSVAESWLESAIAKGQIIPDPIDASAFSGKLVVRMPKSLHRKAAHFAAQEGVSLNQYIVTCVAEQVGEQRCRQHSVASPIQIAVRMELPTQQRAVSGKSYFLSQLAALSDISGASTQSLPLLLPSVSHA